MQYIWLIGLGVMFLCIFFALRNLKKKRLVDDVPTSKAKGVFIGLVELKGKVKCDNPLRSYLTEKPSVYYRWSVQEHWTRTTTEHYTDSKGHRKTRTKTESGWKTVASGGDHKPFDLCDDTGCVLVRPDKAKVEATNVMNYTCGITDPLYYGKGPSTAVPNSDFRRRFKEEIIEPGATLYVFGQSHEREDIVAPEIAYDKEAPMFLISTREEKKVSRSYGFYYWLLLATGLVAGLVTTYFSVNRSFYYPAEPLQPYLITAGIFGITLFLGWFWVVHNSLKSLLYRVDQAKSQIDVQLKRRNDLIPSLVNAVKGMSRYEKEVLEKLSLLRSHLSREETKQTLNIVVEKYPGLKSHSTFMKLQKELVDTEDRISLARGYYNEIASFYNARLERFPDFLICKLSRLKPRNLFTIDNEKERERIEVKENAVSN
ncbi:MAG: hypothetical protein FXF54_01735 [Kosmotoga sp.]|nr:MAG: hypothetical protein FXF54_01735 [Kosmotoga sp.]